MDTDLSGSGQADIGHSDRQGFADPCTSVVEEEQDRVVPHTQPRGAIGLGEYYTYFLWFEITGTGRSVLLGRDGQHAVILFGASGVMAKQMCKEGSYRGKPTVASGPPVLADLFQVPQEPHDMVDVEIFESQVGHGSVLGQEAKEELERVSIGSNGMWACCSDTLQISTEEGFDKGRKRIGQSLVHGVSVL